MFTDLKLKLRGMPLCAQEAGKSRAGEKKKKKKITWESTHTVCYWLVIKIRSRFKFKQYIQIFGSHPSCKPPPCCPGAVLWSHLPVMVLWGRHHLHARRDSCSGRASWREHGTDNLHLRGSEDLLPRDAA